jgi:hypothetical protein
MKVKKSLLFTFLICVAGILSLRAQISVRDSVIPYAAFSADYKYQLPGGDLLWRFGPNSAVGASGLYKTKHNFIYQLQWNYIFGNKLIGDDPLSIIMTSDGHVIDKDGKYADIRIFERGYTLGISSGKVFNNFLSSNKNSGILLMGGVGLLQHKYRIYDNGSKAPQLTKDYLKGYDRLTSGIALNEFVGYWFMSKSRFVNFYAGFDFVQGFTKSRRSWDYSTMSADTEHRTDLLSGVSFGWVIPLYKKTSHSTVYY